MTLLPRSLRCFSDLVIQHPEWDLPALCSALAISPATLVRHCRKFLGISPKQWLLSFRMRCWRMALQEQHEVLDSAIAHFGAVSSAYRHAAHALGMSPASLRRGGAGAWLAFGLVPCVFGNLVVAQSERGVSWVCVQGDPERFTGELIETYPNARLMRMDLRFSRWVETLLERFPRLMLATCLPEQMLLAVLQHHLLQFALRAPIAEALLPSLAESKRIVGSLGFVQRPMPSPNFAREREQICELP
jgi:AraC-like DNA-binding protein